MITGLLSKANPFIQWRARREARHDMKLRRICITLATHYGNDGILMLNLYKAHIIFLYLKYGVAEDGVPLNELFDRHHIPHERRHLYPDRPIKL